MEFSEIRSLVNGSKEPKDMASIFFLLDDIVSKKITLPPAYIQYVMDHIDRNIKREDFIFYLVEDAFSYPFSEPNEFESYLTNSTAWIFNKPGQTTSYPKTKYDLCYAQAMDVLEGYTQAEMANIPSIVDVKKLEKALADKANKKMHLKELQKFQRQFRWDNRERHFGTGDRIVGMISLLLDMKIYLVGGQDPALYNRHQVNLPSEFCLLALPLYNYVRSVNLPFKTGLLYHDFKKKLLTNIIDDVLNQAALLSLKG